MADAGTLSPIETDIPARMDRLPWSGFHLLVVVALGVTWILDGLEVTIVGAIGPALQDHRTLGLSPQDVGGAASCYVVGAILGAIVFGWMTDRLGRRVVFYATLIIYLAGVLLTSISWNFMSFAIFRAFTGMGIGGEYAAINSAIDELIPARLRGRIDIIVNGSFWLGASLGAGASLILLDPHIFPVGLGWRFGFGIGGVLGLGILFLRNHVPESPRWLVTHGHAEEAEKVTKEIEDRVTKHHGEALEKPKKTIKIHPRKVFGFGLIFKTMMGKYRGRSVLALVLMAAQAFLFNAVFFTYGLALAKFYHVPDSKSGLFLLPLTVSNFLGPLLLGHFFDSFGRRKMVTGTFAISAILLTGTALAFGFGWLTALTQTIAWMTIFFFASAAASSAYLTASEIFPLETRALAIAAFYALGTTFGGAAAPWLFGHLMAGSSAWPLAGGYGAAALLMFLAAGMEMGLGVDAEGKPLEDIAAPVSSGGN